jgi:methyl coenzyme M reductase beta subunit
MVDRVASGSLVVTSIKSAEAVAVVVVTVVVVEEDDDGTLSIAGGSKSYLTISCKQCESSIEQYASKIGEKLLHAAR